MSDELVYRVVRVPPIFVLSDRDLATMQRAEARLDALLSPEARERLKAAEAQFERDVLGLPESPLPRGEP